MTFRKRLQYFLVKKLNISNKEAIGLIIKGDVVINNLVCLENKEIEVTDSVSCKGEILQSAKKLLYIAYYKPRGIETTLNTNIANNLKGILPFKEAVFPVGRLDKESEGLLLLTNDGNIYDKILRRESNIEKEYIVEVDKYISEEFLHKMSIGVSILNTITLPTKVEKNSDFVFRIILIQGLNRQIRRMCYKCGYTVVKLTRIRIGSIKIEELKPLEYRYLNNYSIANT